MKACLGFLLAIGLALSAKGAIEFDQNVTPDVLFGSGNANGAFTVDRSNGVELGLRAKERFPTPSNTFNSNGDGTYSHAAGDFSGRAAWNYEFAANVNFDGTTGNTFDDVAVFISIDTDPSQSVDFSIFGFDIGLFGDNEPFGDTSIAQNSQNLGFLPGSALLYDFTQDATYDFELNAYRKSDNYRLASTAMQVIVGEGGAPGNEQIPEPGSVLIWTGLIGACYGLYYKKRKPTAA